MTQTGARQFFYQEMLQGDLRKLEARSNDSTTGGGARDLRFPESAFGALMTSMFPEVVDGRTSENGGQITRGVLHWVDAHGNTQSQNLERWPPTDARPTEGRLARIHEIAGLVDLLPPATDGRVFLVLTEDSTGTVYAEYVTEAQLHSGEIDARVAEPILECVANSGNRRVMGSVNFNGRTRYCHATG